MCIRDREAAEAEPRPGQEGGDPGVGQAGRVVSSSSRHRPAGPPDPGRGGLRRVDRGAEARGADATA
eukprot:5150522-Pyramimonas_sp.AAC.1